MKVLILFLFLPLFLLAQTDCQKCEHNPVLNVGEEGSWDAAAVIFPSVIVDGNTYKMWYAGNDGKSSRIGYATSQDGINWTKADDVNPVLDLGVADSWDDESVSTPHVLFDGAIYKMWYYGHDGTNDRIGYATSPDGITWTKHDGPVMDVGVGGRWDEVMIWGPKVLFADSEFIMWYSGYNGSEIKGGFAKSIDGIVWDKEELNPVLSSTKHWERSYLMSGPVVYNDGVFEMWYSAGLPNENLQTGFATSLDCVNWIKADDINPVINSGQAGDWDYNFASVRSVYFDETNYHMWYDSYDQTNGVIGYATSPIVEVGVEEEKTIPEVYELSQNYPNPFNPSTTIEFSLPNQSYVTLKVFDVLGREVSLLVNEEKSVGNYEVNWNAANNSSGVYFYKVQAEDFVETKKMLLLR